MSNSLRRSKAAPVGGAAGSARDISAGASLAQFALSAYDSLYAPLVSGWVRGLRELEWLAPATDPPLTAAKVQAWGRNGGNRYLYWQGPAWQPLGYAELNPMPDRPHDFWIGHFIIAPDARGGGRGRQFFQSLLCHAFIQLGAKEVLLIVSPDNVRAIQCYEASGMTPAGRETKYFRNRRRRYEFVRMIMSLARFRRWATEGRIIGEPVAFVVDAGQLRQGTLSRQRVLTPG